MNPQIILALLCDLYLQNMNQRDRIKELEAQLEGEQDG